MHDSILSEQLRRELIAQRETFLSPFVTHRVTGNAAGSRYFLTQRQFSVFSEEERERSGERIPSALLKKKARGFHALNTCGFTGIFSSIC